LLNKSTFFKKNLIDLKHLNMQNKDIQCLKGKKRVRNKIVTFASSVEISPVDADTAWHPLGVMTLERGDHNNVDQHRHSSQVKSPIFM